MSQATGQVEVLLATYNGARFLAAQLDSLLKQTRPADRILVRDDGSTDGTPALLAEYAARHPDAILLLPGAVEVGATGCSPASAPNTGGTYQSATRLGACGSFSRLLQHSQGDYVLLCDQDDVWQPEHIALELQRAEQLERQFGADAPILVHSDLAVVDQDLRPLGDSFWAFQHLDAARGGTLNRLLVQNVVTGCTVLVNRALLRAAMPIPPEALMHDWWLALVAAALGRVEHVVQPTVLYRQHGQNQVGARRWGAGYVLRRAWSLLGSQGAAKSLRDTQRQAAALLECLGSQLAPEARAAVEAYAQLGQFGFFQRRRLLWRYGFRKSGFFRNLGLWLRV